MSTKQKLSCSLFFRFGPCPLCWLTVLWNVLWSDSSHNSRSWKREQAPGDTIPLFSFMFMPRNSRMGGLRNPYCGMLDALWSYELPRAMFPYLEICFLGFAAFRKRYASRKVQRNFRGFAASRRQSIASCFYFFLRPFYLIILLKGNLGRLLAWLCLYILRPLVF